MFSPPPISQVRGGRSGVLADGVAGLVGVVLTVALLVWVVQWCC